jgi:hypothetical protein
MRTPCEWGLAYDEDTPCFRERLIVELTDEILEGTIDNLKKKLTGALLELIPSGPTGIKSDLFQLTEQ